MAPEGAKAPEAEIAIAQVLVNGTNYNFKDVKGRADFNTHATNTYIHTNSTEKAAWNAKADISDIPTTTSQLTNNGSDGTAQYLETDEDAYRTSSIPYGACDSSSKATVFTATVPGITELRDGVCMWLKNGVITSAANFTININGLGAKPVYSNMAAATAETTIFNVNYTMLFVYDSTRVSGGCWVCYRGYDSNTNTIGYQLRTNSLSLPMKSATYRYRILFTSADGKYFVPATNSSSNNATDSRTVCQDKINPFGRIVYYGSTTTVAANSRPGATVLWDQYAITFGYSFNRTGAALTLTSWKPVYIKCAPQTDGSAIIDSTTPYVQDLPTTEDGKIYILLGIAYSATAVELMAHHPVYWYKDGIIRPYTNGHEHSNKSVLDGITATNISNWNTAATNSHTHSNKSVLDGISSSDVSAWNAKQNALTEGTDYLNKTHLDAAYVALSSVGANSGVAELDSTGKVPSSQLPSYVDDVVEYASLSNFPATGESGKIYIAVDTNLTYRWGGTEYVNISSSLALGETSSTAYRGDRGKTAYDHSQNGDVHVTTTQKSNWNTAYSNSHTHSNKNVLDGIASTDISAWNSAATNSHTHSNKSTLDTITSTMMSHWDTAYSNSHTHTNKSTLDTITSAKISNWDGAATNSHTHTNKTVLDGISSADVTAWNGAYTKPTTGIPATDLASAVQTSLGLADTAVQDSSYVHTDNNFTSTLKSKLDGIAAGAEVNVQANWSTTDSTSDAFIKNKPSIPTATTTTPKMNGTAAVGTETKWAKGDHVHPVDTSRAASSHTHGNITNGGDMTATAAIASGDRIVINDESASKLTSSTLTFGSSTTQYLANNGTWQNVPTFSQVQADWSTTDSSAVSFIANKPNITTLAETAELSDAIPSTNYQTVSQAEKDSWNAKSTFSGNYSDLNGKPTIPTTLAQLASDTTHRVVTDAQINQWNNNYTLPSSGIPLNDLSQPVRDLLTNKTSLFESDIIIGDVYFKRYAAGRLMVSEVE